MGKNLLNSDGKIALFHETIRLDFNLPKYSVIEQKDPNPSVMSYDFLKQYMESNDKEGVAEFNLTVSPTMLDSVKTNQEHKQVRTSLLGINHKENSWFKKIKDYVDEYRSSKFDVIHFFSEVKIQTENEMKQYRDRIKDYILMLGYAERSGQYALKEKTVPKHGDMQIRKHIVQQRIIQGYIRGKSYEVCKRMSEKSMP